MRVSSLRGQKLIVLAVLTCHHYTTVRLDLTRPSISQFDDDSLGDGAK